MSSRALPPFLASIVGWLRAGYPEGVPDHDYLPLFALLRRRLTADEVDELATTLAEADDSASVHAVRTAISELTNGAARDQDIARVSARLAAGGWPNHTGDRTTPVAEPHR